jgi:hypothetical protein
VTVDRFAATKVFTRRVTRPSPSSTSRTFASYPSDDPTSTMTFSPGGTDSGTAATSPRSTVAFPVSFTPVEEGPPPDDVSPAVGAGDPEQAGRAARLDPAVWPGVPTTAGAGPAASAAGAAPATDPAGIAAGTTTARLARATSRTGTIPSADGMEGIESERLVRAA